LTVKAVVDNNIYETALLSKQLKTKKFLVKGYFCGVETHNPQRTFYEYKIREKIGQADIQANN
jgi:hypothetical protein